MTDRISTDELRKLLGYLPQGYGGAYDRLEELAPDLAAEVIELREALEGIAESLPKPRIGLTDCGERAHYLIHACLKRDRARAALNHKETDNGAS